MCVWGVREEGVQHQIMTHRKTADTIYAKPPGQRRRRLAISSLSSSASVAFRAAIGDAPTRL